MAAQLRRISQLAPMYASFRMSFLVSSADVAPSHPEVFAKLTDSAKRLGIPAMPLASPASHDTATFTVAGVPSFMLFVRNANGSHNPHEAMEIDDFLKAAAVLTHFIATESASQAP